MTSPADSDAHHPDNASRAMALSLAAGGLQLIIKLGAWLMTASTAVFADAAESAVHLLAVLFAALSLRISRRPPDREHTYGHGKIGFFSAGVEGAVIFITALYIMGESIRSLLAGPAIHAIGWGILLTALSVLLNGAVGWHLIATGKRLHNLILVANGWHVLTDCFTSLGVIAGLLLAKLTQWLYWDPVCALLVATHILITGSKLLHAGFAGLMDEASDSDIATAKAILDRELTSTGVSYHHLRMRHLGDRLAIDLHLVFDDHLSIRDAHEIATHIERTLAAGFSPAATVMTHLEPRGDHNRLHPSEEMKRK